MSQHITKKRLIQRYNVNLDGDSALVLSHAFVDAIQSQKKAGGKKNSFKLTDKNKESIGGIIDILGKHIKNDYQNDHVQYYEMLEIKKLHDNGEYNLLFLQKLIHLIGSLNIVDLLVSIVEEREERAITLLKNISLIGSVIPFESFSIQEFLYKKVEKTISDINSEIDNYKHINNSIISMILSFAGALGAIFSIRVFPETLHGVIYWFVGILGLVFLFYFIDLFKNFIETRKRIYILRCIEALIYPFDEPKNFNGDYLKMIKEFLLVIKEYRASEVSNLDYSKAKDAIRIFKLFKLEKRFRFIYSIIVDIVREKYIVVVFLFFYFFILWYYQTIIINFLIGYQY